MDVCPPESGVTRYAQGSSSAGTIAGTIDELTRSSGARAVIISSVHDYRSKRRGSIQAIADAMVRRGMNVSFVSIRFSPLSFLKRDSRSFLWKKANKTEDQRNVSCFLWATPFHPFATRTLAGDKLTSHLHDLYAAWPNRDLDALIRQADFVVVESGLGIALAPRIRRLNPSCRLIYRGSDTLQTIGAHPHLATLLADCADAFDQFCLLSPQMAEAFLPVRARTFCVPQGIERAHYETIGENPYPDNRSVVSVGSMLFDHSVFDVAAEAFPDRAFHVIGCGRTWRCAPNIILYPEMKFLETLPYVAHANIGVAAYRSAQRCRYLADSSMKLAQYSYLRLPAVCPHFAVGRHAHRFGYTPNAAKEIVSAFEAAFADHFDDDAPTAMTWDDLVIRLLDPAAFPDTHIPHEMFEPSEASVIARNGGAGRPFAAGRSADEDLRVRG